MPKNQNDFEKQVAQTNMGLRKFERLLELNDDSDSGELREAISHLKGLLRQRIEAHLRMDRITKLLADHEEYSEQIRKAEAKIRGSERRYRKMIEQV